MASEEIESTLSALMSDMPPEEKAEFVKQLYATGFQKIAAGEEVSQKNIRILNSLRNEIKDVKRARRHAHDASGSGLWARCMDDFIDTTR